MKGVYDCRDDPFSRYDSSRKEDSFNPYRKPPSNESPKKTLTNVRGEGKTNKPHRCSPTKVHSLITEGTSARYNYHNI